MIPAIDTPRSDPRSVPPPDAACAHCGLPVGRHPVGDDPWFCCSSCRTVHDVLRDSGLSDRYYRLRDIGRTGDARPAVLADDESTLAELGSPLFLERHTRQNADGTRSAELVLDGVHCAACVWLVERLPHEVGGVREARLDLARARLSLTWDPETVELSRVARWLSRFGYTAHPGRGDGASESTGEERRLLVRMGVAWALAGNVMLIALAFYSGLAEEGSGGLWTAGRWMSLLLALPSAGWAGLVFFRRAWHSVRRAAKGRSLRHLDMDTPIAVGIAVGMADSIHATVTGRGEVWFDSLTVLIAALLTARFLQLRSRRLAGDASDRLLSLVPTMARRLSAAGGEERVPSETLGVGDRIVVAPGEVVPADGSVEAGESRIDQAVVTGESVPVAVAPGVAILAGVTNLTASLVIRVTAAGDATRVGRLLAWVRDASSRRAPVVQLADRLSGFFVATVLTLALVTFVAWRMVEPGAAVSHVVALLVITCPCALGMATPLAMAVAAGRAARAGVFVKGESAFQTLEQARVVVLDKTGTLTAGRPAVLDVAGDPTVLAAVAALESDIPHPIARALSETAPADGPPAVDVTFEAGRGVSGTVDGVSWAAGRIDWIAARTDGMPADLARAAQAAAEAGRTPIAVAKDGRAVSVIALGDPVRPEAADLVRSLTGAGFELHICSGDHRSVVLDVARAVGIPPERALGGVEPEDKKALVERLQGGGRTVVMIGDGVNDAAALSQADVGIAVPGGTQASLVAADVFLTSGGLASVALVFSSSRRVMGVIRRNLGLSLVYNVVVAALAIAGRVDPLLAAVAMPVSSLAVVLSSIAQRTFRRAPYGDSNRP